MTEQQTVFCIGIGGIGMSALARLLVHDGHTVRGSDRSRSLVTQALERDGISVIYDQHATNITDEIDTVVYTAAVSDDHPELAEARRRGLAVYTYAQMLGQVSAEKETIAVAGSHGKTTTTAMIAHILEHAQLSPTVIVGSLRASNTPGEYTSNFTPGTPVETADGVVEYFVVEADEYQRSFHELSPTVLIITNVDTDHLDYYRDLAEIQEAFRVIAERVPRTGAVVCNPAAANVKPVLREVTAPIIDYTSISSHDLALPIPGVHNRMNAQAAIAAAGKLGVDEERAKEALSTFRGTWRRYEYVGTVPTSGAVLYDDYAHHPTEISTTLAGFREHFPDRRLVVIFQPHTYTRTTHLADQFAKSFAAADELVVAPIYAARETPPENHVDHHELARRIQTYHENVTVFDSFDAISEHVRSQTTSDSVVVTMGAGDIYTIHPQLTT